jgi:carbon-monoxide dehydrogenase medium subunit
MWQAYLFPKTIEETLRLLADWAGEARVIAGGTDLVLQLKRGERQTACLIDISRITALRSIAEADGLVTVGAAVTHAEAAASPLIQKYAPVLSQAAAEVGSPEIRNVATLGGNVVNAQPAADAALALLALDAEAEIVGAEGSHWVPLSDLYGGAGVSTVDSSAELLRGFRFQVPALRLPSGQTVQVGSAYRRLGKCKSIALPVLCAATIVRLEGERFVSAAISLGPIAPRPYRAGIAEASLVGRPATAGSIARAATMARQEARPRDSLLRCAKVYREAMVSVLVQSTLEQAIAAARQPAEGVL